MRTIAIACAALLLAGCARTVKVQTDPASGKMDVDVGQAGANEGWSGTLNAVGGSGVTGSVTGTSGHDMTMVTINVAGAPAGTLAWHVHEGKCTDTNPPVVGPGSAYPALNVGADGRGTAMAHLDMDLNEAKSYIVMVHNSAMRLLACGDFDD